ncbi:MAG: RES family NAD+ phosphorylase [Pseudomonadota bacterium]
MAGKALTQTLVDGWTWWRIADPAWRDPLDAHYAARAGARWNPPDSFPTLYLNEDQVTARTNLRLFIARWPYEPEDLRTEHAPVLIGAQLPRRQEVAQLTSPAGLAAVGLPPSYPIDEVGRQIGHDRCQGIAASLKAAGLRGLRVRCAQSAQGEGRELAWFPATVRSRARLTARLSFAEWYWG